MTTSWKWTRKKNDELKDDMQLLYPYQAEAISSKFDEWAVYSSTLYHSKYVDYTRKKKQNMLTTLGFSKNFGFTENVSNEHSFEHWLL